MFELRSWLGLLVACLAAIAAAVIATVIVSAVVRLIARREAWARLLSARARAPFRVLLMVIALWAAFSISMPAHFDSGWAGSLHHLLLIATIAAGAWFACALVIFFEDLGLSRYRLDTPDNRVARRIRTQVLIIRRLTVVAAVVVGFGAILLTFPGARAAGASVLASAGIISVIAGVAAQSTLANVFAGMQLAFNGAIRIDDVVVVEQQWGKIEEITLTYVVVHVWDDRRLVLPSSYFTTTPFENWTRQHSELLGSVEFDLDWRITPAEMRKELARLLGHTDLWDHRVGVLQVTDAVGGFVRVRVLVTAKDAPTLFDLRCYVREGLIAWMHRSSEESFPRSRVQLAEQNPEWGSRPRRGDADAEGLFTGSADAEQRATQFTESIPIQRRSRDAH
ncbi:mechanosensitive ion channel [Microbacterium sp. STN6]|uniref:mechanosensitive ion channel family protein n=1 Tax=Microbacterium sp. STN6 TaxID=2995588 RepID=UPI002260D447|nr:mechanosensitive ion channel domain-containing protein [Microbacterium sp. STN6]MCX7522952.1 mechanosensitive ion channel [Microbacterium sp. STN6]